MNIETNKEILRLFGTVELSMELCKKYLREAITPDRMPPFMSEHYLNRNKPILLEELNKLIKALTKDESDETSDVQEGLKPKANFNTTLNYVKYVKEVSEHPFICMFNEKYSNIAECAASSRSEDMSDKFDCVIKLKSSGAKITCNLKDVTTKYTEDLWLKPGILRNITIKKSDLSSDKLNAFVFPKYVLNNERTKFVKSGQYYLVSREVVNELISAVQLFFGNSRVDKGDYYCIAISDIEQYAILLNDDNIKITEELLLNHFGIH